MSDITDRIEREAGVPGLAAILAERLSPTDLQSLLLEVTRLRAARIQPAALLATYAANRFVRPAAVDPARLLQWEQVALDHLPPGFEPLALSPVCPLGAVSAVAPVDQNWTVATARNTEVVSDSTNVLALECALRRKALLRATPKSAVPVHLAASHRLLRAQPFEGPISFAHFSAFTLCSAGRDQGTLRFELDALRLHIAFYLCALRAFLGPGVPLAVAMTDFGAADTRAADARASLVRARLLAPLQQDIAGLAGTVTFGFDPERTSGRGYYAPLCFHIYATAHADQPIELVDGGIVDWTQRLLSNAKERLVISGIGSERLCAAL